MSREVDFIKDVDDGQEHWKLAVRVEDLWKSGIGKNEHIEFLILDKQVNIFILYQLIIFYIISRRENNFLSKQIRETTFKCYFPQICVLLGGQN
jgi:hypothetical protein